MQCIGSILVGQVSKDSLELIPMPDPLDLSLEAVCSRLSFSLPLELLIVSSLVTQLYVFAKTSLEICVPGHEDSKSKDGSEKEEDPRRRKPTSHGGSEPGPRE